MGSGVVERHLEMAQQTKNMSRLGWIKIISLGHVENGEDKRS